MEVEIEIRINDNGLTKPLYISGYTKYATMLSGDVKETKSILNGCDLLTSEKSTNEYAREIVRAITDVAREKMVDEYEEA